MKKKKKSQCPKVRAKIEEAKRRRSLGLCWCDCVNDDIPDAEAKCEKGDCGAANSIIQAALARCDEPVVKPVKEFKIKPLEW